MWVISKFNLTTANIQKLLSASSIIGLELDSVIYYIQRKDIFNMLSLGGYINILRVNEKIININSLFLFFYPIKR